MPGEAEPRWGWGNRRRAPDAEPFLAPVAMGARGRRALGPAGQRALRELKRSLPPYLSLSVFGSQLRGNYFTPPDRSSDVDLLVVVEGEVSPQEAERAEIAVERVRARIGVYFHLFLISARTLWQKLSRGDFQILNLLMIAAAVEDVGLSNALRGLIFSGVVGYGPDEPRRLLELARRTLEQARGLLDQGRLEKPLASALHLAACSAVQAYLLRVARVDGTLRLVPKDLPGLFREWAAPPATAGQVEAFEGLCAFFRRFKAVKGAVVDPGLARQQVEECRGLIRVAEQVAGPEAGGWPAAAGGRPAAAGGLPAAVGGPPGPRPRLRGGAGLCKSR